MNQIGSLRIETPRAIYFDSYRDNRTTGSFILIDPVSNATVASGMITGAARDGKQFQHDSHRRPVTPGERAARWGHRGAVVELGNRKELGRLLERRLFEHGSVVAFLEDYTEAALQAFRSAGFIAIVASGEGGRFQIRTSDGETALNEQALPERDEEAVQAIYSLLERTQILLPAQIWGESDGI